MGFLEHVQFFLKFVLECGTKIFHWITTTEPFNYYLACTLLLIIAKFFPTGRIGSAIGEYVSSRRKNK